MIVIRSCGGIGGCLGMGVGGNYGGSMGGESKDTNWVRVFGTHEKPMWA